MKLKMIFILILLFIRGSLFAESHRDKTFLKTSVKDSDSQSDFTIKYFESGAKFPYALIRSQKSCLLEYPSKNNKLKESKKLSLAICDQYFHKNRGIFNEQPPIIADVGGSGVGNLTLNFQGTSWAISARPIDFELCDIKAECQTPKSSTQGEAAKALLQVAHEVGVHNEE